jgi:hypothetical protein
VRSRQEGFHGLRPDSDSSSALGGVSPQIRGRDFIAFNRQRFSEPDDRCTDRKETHTGVKVENGARRNRGSHVIHEALDQKPIALKERTHVPDQGHRPRYRLDLAPEPSTNPAAGHFHVAGAFVGWNVLGEIDLSFEAGINRIEMLGEPVHGVNRLWQQLSRSTRLAKLV